MLRYFCSNVTAFPELTPSRIAERKDSLAATVAQTRPRLSRNLSHAGHRCNAATTPATQQALREGCHDSTLDKKQVQSTPYVSSLSPEGGPTKPRNTDPNPVSTEPPRGGH